MKNLFLFVVILGIGLVAYIAMNRGRYQIVRCSELPESPNNRWAICMLDSATGKLYASMRTSSGVVTNPEELKWFQLVALP